MILILTAALVAVSVLALSLASVIGWALNGRRVARKDRRVAEGDAECQGAKARLAMETLAVANRRKADIEKELQAEREARADDKAKSTKHLVELLNKLDASDRDRQAAEAKAASRLVEFEKLRDVHLEEVAGLRQEADTALKARQDAEARAAASREANEALRAEFAFVREVINSAAEKFGLPRA